MREFLGEWDIGPLHGHPFTLKGRGAATKLHKHERDHTVYADKRIAVYALWPDGVEKAEAFGRWPDKRLIPAGVEHIVIALEEGDTFVECVFSRYDEKGVLLLNPKKIVPYTEDTSGVELPQLLQDLLTSEGVACAG